ncbi:MAG: replication initiation protein, partial [Cetobacterium sp.]
KNLKEVTFSFVELRKLSNYSNRSIQRLYSDLDKVYKKMLELNLKYEDDKEIRRFVLFSKYVLKKNEKTVTIKASEDFEYILNNLIGKFTKFDLIDFVNLKSSYSKNMFKLLKQWETKKERIFKIDELKEILGIPKGFSFGKINERVLNPIMNELPQHFNNLKLEKIKTGKKVTSLNFTWSRKVEKIESPQKDDVIDTIEISDKLNKSIEKAKKNRFIAPLLTIDNIEILVQMFQEKDLIKGLNWSYIEIKQEIKSLNYLIKSIKTGMEQKEKKLVVKTVSEVVQEQETKEEIIKENDLGLEKAEELKITEIEKIKIIKDEYEDLYKKFLEEQKTEHNLLTRKGFDIANKNKYEIIEKANNIMKIENEISKIIITKEKYELLYQNFIILNDCIDNQNTRESFDLLNKEKYKIVEQTITIPITIQDLDKVSFNEMEGKKIISISDIPEEKL